MNKNSLLKSIALKGYDVGFGAKKHFATYDLASKAPNLIAFDSVGVKIPINSGLKFPNTHG